MRNPKEQDSLGPDTTETNWKKDVLYLLFILFDAFLLSAS